MIFCRLIASVSTDRDSRCYYRCFVTRRFYSDADHARLGHIGVRDGVGVIYFENENWFVLDLVGFTWFSAGKALLIIY